jgi:hypothetical protein
MAIPLELFQRKDRATGEGTSGAPAAVADPITPAPELIAGKFTDAQILGMWTKWKAECLDQRWIWERQFMRNLWYVLNRQWIYFDSKRGQWADKRLAKWIPRPVTNICKEAIQAVRANFAAINYGTNARPEGEDNANVITASVADDYAPILHEDHAMDQVLNEFDFWLLATGNAWLHAAVEKDRKYGVVKVHHETCQQCQQDYAENEIADAGQKCPSCDGTAFQPTVDPITGEPKVDEQPLTKGVTYALSPFEILFPLVYERFDLVPYCVRARWRDKSYYEQNPALAAYVHTLNFGKTPSERTMQIFKTLPFQNDMGIAPPYFASGGANADAEGVVEYDIYIKPCADFPQGQVIRIAGDAEPVVIHNPEEALPGPLPIVDAKGNGVWPFFHARYDEVGGRPLGSSLIDPIIGIQDQINQIDSHCLMILGRMANPIWLEPKGAEVERFTGEPGLVVKWNPLVAGGNAKPERMQGMGIDQSIIAYRQMKKQEAEELTGTYDILKGSKPSGVEAFAALNLLVERSLTRHASAFQERGRAYRGWFRVALEIERNFGDETRVRAVMSPTKGWAFETFKKADLGGAITIIIEDGTLTPKTSLGERAAIEHLRQLGLLNPQDPDQVMAIYQKFGQARLLPGLDAQVQEAWMNMDRFEKFISDPQAIQAAQQQAQAAIQQAQATGQPTPTNLGGPLTYKRWYNPQIHRQELIKWCLSDRGRAVFEKQPAAEQMVDAYLSTIDLALAQAQQGIIDAAGVPQQVTPPGGPGSMKPDTQPGGAGASMANSNRNAAGAGDSSSGGASSGSGGQQKPVQPTDIAATGRAISYNNAHPTQR